MKKILALLLMVVLATSLLTGCSDPVYDDLSNFLNVEMVQVNADYEALKAELATWETMTDDATLANHINTVLVPLVDGSLKALDNINPATEEVKEIKAKYVKVIETYKEGFVTLAAGCATQDDATINTATDLIASAVDYLNEYNAALETLAAEHGAEIEY